MAPRLFASSFLIIILLSCCNGIKTDKTLSTAEKLYIQNLGLLDSGETIIKFNSQLNNRVSGNFFSNKRLASYWIDQHDTLKNQRAFALYRDIAAIDTTYLYTSLTYASYMEVARRDSSKFRVYVDGKKEEVRSFFEDALSKWNIENRLRSGRRLQGEDRTGTGSR